MNNRLRLTLWSVASILIFAGGWMAGRSKLKNTVDADPHGMLQNISERNAAALLPARSALMLLEEALTANDSFERQAAAIRSIMAMNSDELEAATNALLARRKDPGVARMLDFLWQRFGEVDGSRALRRAGDLIGYAQRSQAMESVLRGIALNDPEGAWQAGLASRNLLGVADILHEYGDANFLFARLSELPDGFQKVYLSHHIASFLARYKPEALLPAVSSMPPGRSRSVMLSSLAAEWGRLDSSTAVEWAASLEGQERVSVLSSALRAWIERAPEASAKWFLT